MSLIRKLAKAFIGKSPRLEHEDSDEELVEKQPQKRGSGEKKRRNKLVREGKEGGADGQKRQRGRRGPRQNKPSNQDQSSRQDEKRGESRGRRRPPRKKTTNPQQKASKSAVVRPPKPKGLGADAAGFRGLGLRDEILAAVGDEGYSNPTPIQKASIADLVKGRDLLGCAQTGTGKTASFALPTLHRLSQLEPEGRPMRALILTPTRELALQVAESYSIYGRNLNLKTAVIFGGVGHEPQKKALEEGVDILVATPGRLLDLHGQGVVDFGRINTLVLDEADRMLDMGFLPDVKRILAMLPPSRHNILFSATMPPAIEELSMGLLRDPVKVEVAPVSSASERVEQSVYKVLRPKKKDLLLHVLQDEEFSKVLVFTRTKAIANRISKFLVTRDISSEAIHGNKSQSARQRALNNFKSGEIRVLVASDLAARGLDVNDISHVINYDIPNIPETYVHRIGRTGRAEATGKALSFCDPDDSPHLVGIEKLIGKPVPLVENHPFQPQPSEFVPSENPPGQRGQRGRRPQNRGSRGPRGPRKGGSSSGHRPRSGARNN